jgi:hypothetical protein
MLIIGAKNYNFVFTIFFSFWFFFLMFHILILNFFKFTFFSWNLKGKRVVVKWERKKTIVVCHIPTTKNINFGVNIFLSPRRFSLRYLFYHSYHWKNRSCFENLIWFNLILNFLIDLSIYNKFIEVLRMLGFYVFKWRKYIKMGFLDSKPITSTFLPPKAKPKQPRRGLGSSKFT